MQHMEKGQSLGKHTLHILVEEPESCCFFVQPVQVSFTLHSFFLPQPRIFCLCWRSHIRCGWLPASSVLSEKIPFLQRSQSCHWSLWELQVWNISAANSVLHNLTFSGSLTYRWASSTRWGLLYLLFYIFPISLFSVDTLYPPSPKKGQTIHGCDLPL